MNEAVFFALSVVIAAVLIAIAGVALAVYNSATAKLATYVELRDAQPALIAYNGSIYICYGFKRPVDVVLYNVQGQGWMQPPVMMSSMQMQNPIMQSSLATLSAPYVYCGWVDIHDIPINITIVLSYNGVTVIQKYQLRAAL